MSLLSFKKPKKVRSTEDHNSTFSSDCGVEGTYVPNMSGEDVERWKAKFVAGTTDHPQIEIRKDSFVIVVGLDGYNYKHYKETKYQIHIASAGPIMLDWEDWYNFVAAVGEARSRLLLLEGKKTLEDKKIYIKNLEQMP